MDRADDGIIADGTPFELSEMLKQHWSLEKRKELCKHLIDGLTVQKTVKPSTSYPQGMSSGSRKKPQETFAAVAAPFQD